MSLTQRLRTVVKPLIRRFGYDLIQYNPSRTGNDSMADICRFLRGTPTPMLLDVGANVGQTVESLRSAFPRATIHAFEPAGPAFESLSKVCAGQAGTRAWNVGVGAEPGRLALNENSASVMSSFLPLGEHGWGEVVTRREVDVVTLDQFARDQGIAHIDLLKSDTQGFDFQVLQGARGLLEAGRISLVFFEYTFSRQYQGIAPFHQAHALLAGAGYELAAFYRPFVERDIISWMDVLFIHRSHLERFHATV